MVDLPVDKGVNRVGQYKRILENNVFAGLRRSGIYPGKLGYSGGKKGPWQSRGRLPGEK